MPEPQLLSYSGTTPGVQFRHLAAALLFGQIGQGRVSVGLARRRLRTQVAKHIDRQARHAAIRIGQDQPGIVVRRIGPAHRP